MDKVLDLIRKNNGNITFKNILNQVNIPRNELLDIITKLKVNGKILQVGNKYQLFPNDLNIGSVTITLTGRKYIYYNHEKIPISEEHLKDLILNDTVTFTINENNEAEVKTLVDRQLGKMTCQVKDIDGKKVLIPFNKDIRFKFDYKILDKLTEGDVIVIEIITDNIMEVPTAKYIDKLGRIDDPLIDDVAVAVNYGFDNVYDDEYLKEVEK